MGQIPRMPLEKRIQAVKSERADFLAAFKLFKEDFLQEVLDMTGNAAAVLKSCEKVDSYDPFDGKAKTVVDMVEIADGLPEMEKSELLDNLLIVPFAAMENERRRQNGLEFINAGHCERNL